MNAKQTVQIAPAISAIAAAAPPLLVIAGIGCGIYFGLKWLFSSDKKKKPEAAPSVPERPAFRPQISAGNTVQNRDIPRISAEKPTMTPAPSVSVSVVPVSSVPTLPKNLAIPKIPIPPLSVFPTGKIQPENSQPARKKMISREDMAKVFSGSGMTRKAAVSALKALGYGKTAAYQALEINGRFAPYLQFASDGIISWKMDGN